MLSLASSPSRRRFAVVAFLLFILFVAWQFQPWHSQAAQEPEVNWPAAPAAPQIAAPQMPVGRDGHTATLLPNGKVFVASGLRGGGGVVADYSGSAEIYDPASRGWSNTNSPQSRAGHTATLLLNGKVMLTGGLTRSDACGEVSRFDTDLFDVAAGSVGLVFGSDDLNQPREFHTATLLPNGQALVVGGRGATCNATTGLTATVRGDAELFDVGLGNIDLPSRPVITDVNWPGPGNALTAEGIRFQSVSEAAGGGAQSSGANFPIAQLRSLANDQTLLLTPDLAAGLLTPSRPQPRPTMASR